MVKLWQPVEKAFLAVGQVAYPKGVSTRKADALMKALRLRDIDKSKVSHICRELDQAVEQFRYRELQERHPYTWLNALHLKVWQNHHIVSLDLVIAVGVDVARDCNLLGFELGGSEAEAF